MSERDLAIQFDKLCYSHKSDWSLKKTASLKELVLSVYSGESFGFLGHNGAGKTTAIKCLLGLLTIESGTARIFGEAVPSLASRRSVGYLPEQPYFYDHLTVRELMEMYATLAGVASRNRKRLIEKALSLVHMQFKAKSKMRSLSKGLMQRVAMAQAIVAEPKLLILDEPFSGLDPLGRKEFADLLFHLHERGTTIFMSSHILTDVEFLCQRVSIMVNGKLEGIFDIANDMPQMSAGTYELVLRNYNKAEDRLLALGKRVSNQERFMRLQFEDRQKAEQALSLALEEGIGVEAFQYKHSTLEDVFLALVEGQADRGNRDKAESNVEEVQE